MLYALICTDKPGSLALRKANRPEHLAYLESLGDTLMFAGPFTEADGETMNGSLIVVEASTLDAARAIAAGDPFAKAGMFASVDIRPWLWSINNPTRRSEQRGPSNRMAYWLMKSEPETWSWDQQKKEGRKGAEWDGVRNFQARNNMREMKQGRPRASSITPARRRPWSASSRW